MNVITGCSVWYAADLKFDGKVLSKISTGEVVENYESAVYRGCTKQQINEFVLNRVNKVLTNLESVVE